MVACTSMSVSTPKPSVFKAAVTLSTAASKGPLIWVSNPYSLMVLLLSGGIEWRHFTRSTMTETAARSGFQRLLLHLRPQPVYRVGPQRLDVDHHILHLLL